MAWKIFRVSGSSMNPTVNDGDFIVAKNYQKTPIEGSVAVIQHPILGVLIKRINSTRNAKTFTTSGDNTFFSQNSAVGLVTEREIKYQAIWRLSPHGVSRLTPR